MFRKVIYTFIFFIWSFMCHVNAFAQCSMCRASMENSISKDSDQFSAGLNTGILYLFIMPYLLFGVIVYFWHKASRGNVHKQNNAIKR